MQVLQEMADVSSERGGQSGGIVTLLHSGSSVSGLRVRVMPGKRQSLAKEVSCPSICPSLSPSPPPLPFFGKALES